VIGDLLASGRLRGGTREGGSPSRPTRQRFSAGQFREDRFYRLNVIQVCVPPLREGSEEIPLLTEYFMQRYSTLFGRDRVTLPSETVQRLLRHRFPGNVRELENVIKRIIVLADPDLRRSALPASSGAKYKIPGPARTAAISLKDISRKAAQVAEREAMLQALEQTLDARGDSTRG
jgi:two-component system response regulator AtoC